jgi:hypothetical protein
VSPDSTLHFVILVAVGALIIGLLTHFVRASYNIRITVRGGEVQIAGTALASRRSVMSTFFAEWLPDVRNARLYGHWDGRRLSLHGSGLNRAQMQRLRNFLLTEL